MSQFSILRLKSVEVGVLNKSRTEFHNLAAKYEKEGMQAVSCCFWIRKKQNT